MSTEKRRACALLVNLIVPRTGGEVNLVAQSPVDRVTDPDVEDQGQVLVNGVFRCILSEANPDPVDVVQKVFRKPGHAVSRVYLSTLSVRTTNRENGGQFIHCLSKVV